MDLFKLFTRLFINEPKYKSHPEAVIISCYFNPTGNPYRLKAFNKFYESIKHTNHRIIECVIGDSLPELPETQSIRRVYTKDMLWHKESLLNSIVEILPINYKYVFWVDADVLFTNTNWIIDGVKALQKNNVIQPFEYCVHLEKDQNSPNFDLENEKKYTFFPQFRHPNLWRSFSANHTIGTSGDENYDKHGHVGFAWGAKREILDSVPLYDRALIGGADHIIAHAAAGQINHSCIMKSFTDDIDAVMAWSADFYSIVDGKIGYVKGDLFHIWHGDLDKRQYLKRVQEFTPMSKDITERDKNGLYVTDDDSYVKDYMEHREDTGTTKNYPIKVEASKKYGNFGGKYETKEQKSAIKVANASKYGAYGTKGKSKLTEKIIKTAKERGYTIHIDEDIEVTRERLRRQHPTSDSSFIDSLLIGYLTDSTMDGALIGGNLLGAMIGDALNSTDQEQAVFNFGGDEPQGFDNGFGNGEFSGGGSGGDWNDTPSTENNDNTTSNNFS